MLPFANTKFDLIVIASSAGGISALFHLLAALPATFKAAIAIVQHTSPLHKSRLANLLNRRCVLTVKDAQEGEVLHPATVYLAMPNRHLLLNLNGSLSLTDTAKVNYVRPAADRLFETASAALKDRLIGVVLTGYGRDGASGVKAIGAAHGFIITQDQATSEAFGMPGAANATGMVNLRLPLAEIAPMLVTMLEG